MEIKMVQFGIIPDMEINKYIYKNANDYYVIKNRDILYVYDFNHILIAQTKTIKNVIRVLLSNDNRTIYFWAFNRTFIYSWDIYDKIHQIIST